MSSLVVIGPQIQEKHRGHIVPPPPPPAYMVPKDPSLNRVKGTFFVIFTFRERMNMNEYMTEL